MTKTLDLSFIRYLNLFEKITRVRTNNCFIFNNILYFAVPSNLVYRAIGEKGSNVRKLAEILNKKVKIVGMPEKPEDAEKFIKDIIAPIEPRNIEMTEKEIVINAGKMHKASLIGRDKTRLKELAKIVNDYFGKELRIQ
jgi:NusA-like KH domain protein